MLSNNSIIISTLFVITFSEKAHACSYFIHMIFVINVEHIPYVEYKHFSYCQMLVLLQTILASIELKMK